MMGSGTIGISSCKCNRKFIGIEKDKRTFGIAKSRITSHTPCPIVWQDGRVPSSAREPPREGYPSACRSSHVPGGTMWPSPWHRSSKAHVVVGNPQRWISRTVEHPPIPRDFESIEKYAAASSKNSVSFDAGGCIIFSENCCSTTSLCLIWTKIYLVSVGPVVIGSVEGLGNVLHVKNQDPLWQNKNSKKLCMTNYKIGWFPLLQITKEKP